MEGEFTRVITGEARIIVGGESYSGIRYDIAIRVGGVRRSLVFGTINADSHLIAKAVRSPAVIELGDGLGLFHFRVINVERREIHLLGPAKNKQNPKPL